MISIVVPVYNEEAGIRKFIDRLRELISDVETELIFVDGGSSDSTVRIIQENGIKVIISEKKGRASQMNLGAHHSKGEILYFLHSDSYPPEGFLQEIQSTVRKGYSSGCFQLSFKPGNIFLRIYAWFTRFDLDFFRFGDQSLFVEKNVFQSIGGFDESLMVMEDQEIVKSLKEISDFRILNKKVETSSRKYTRIGTLKLQIIFTLIVVMHYIGIKQETIVDFYSRQL